MNQQTDKASLRRSARERAERIQVARVVAAHKAWVAAGRPINSIDIQAIKEQAQAATVRP